MHRHDNDEEEAMLAGGQVSDEEKYQNCDRFKFSCPQCEREMIFDGVFSGAVSRNESSLIFQWPVLKRVIKY